MNHSTSAPPGPPKLPGLTTKQLDLLQMNEKLARLRQTLRMRSAKRGSLISGKGANASATKAIGTASGSMNLEHDKEVHSASPVLQLLVLTYLMSPEAGLPLLSLCLLNGMLSGPSAADVLLALSSCQTSHEAALHEAVFALETASIIQCDRLLLGGQTSLLITNIDHAVASRALHAHTSGLPLDGASPFLAASVPFKGFPGVNSGERHGAVPSGAIGAIDQLDPGLGVLDTDWEEPTSTLPGPPEVAGGSHPISSQHPGKDMSIDPNLLETLVTSKSFMTRHSDDLTHF